MSLPENSRYEPGYHVVVPFVAFLASLVGGCEGSNNPGKPEEILNTQTGDPELHTEGSPPKVEPEALTFSAAFGAVTPKTKSFYVTFYGDELQAGVPTGDLASWLTLRASDPPGPFPGAVEVRILSTRIDPGDYSQIVRIAHVNNPIGRPRQLLGFRDVLVQYSLKEQLKTTPQRLTFHTVSGSPSPPTQKVSIFGTRGSWTAVPDKEWLQAEPASGVGPTKIELSVDPKDLGPGVHSATLSVATDGAEAQDVAVVMNVEANRLLLSAEGVSLIKVPELERLVGVVKIRSRAEASLKVSADTNTPWIKLELDQTETPAKLTIQADPGGLAPGDHFGTVTLSRGGAPPKIRVGLRIGETSTETLRFQIRKDFSDRPVLLANPVMPWIYLKREKTIELYDAVSGALLETLHEGIELGAITINGDGTELFVVDEDLERIVVIDAATLEIIRRYDQPLFDHCFNCVFFKMMWTRAGGRPVLVSNRGQVFDAKEGTLLSEDSQLDDRYYRLPGLWASPFGDKVLLAEGELLQILELSIDNLRTPATTSFDVFKEYQETGLRVLAVGPHAETMCFGNKDGTISCGSYGDFEPAGTSHTMLRKILPLVSISYDGVVHGMVDRLNDNHRYVTHLQSFATNGQDEPVEIDLDGEVESVAFVGMGLRMGAYARLSNNIGWLYFLNPQPSVR